MNVRLLMFAASVALIVSGCGDDDAGDSGPTDASADGGPGRDGSAPAPVCGDGFVEGTEQCDDGDVDDGDGCSAACALESGWECKKPGSSCARSVVCGDGIVNTGEVCDDGNATGRDGCSADCKSLETNFACPTPGVACVSTMVCGDGKLVGSEQCDDGNTVALDGCSADCKTVEEGWACPVVGAKCRAAKCGDGKRIGAEQCDDGEATPDNGDGCDKFCQIEPGFVCPADASCRPTVCGDDVKEGSEQCDDGNALPFDACYQCQNEPACTNDGCVAVCGDGIVFPGEECDDGNVSASDGCSAVCTLEQGYTCVNQTEGMPSIIKIPLIYRDFRGEDLPAIGSSADAGHPDFETNPYYAQTGIVGSMLGPDKKPVYAAPDDSEITHGKPYFDQWYNNTDRVNVAIPDTLDLRRQPDQSYVFDDTDVYDDGFFPLDTRGWVGRNLESLRADEDGDLHNYHFTSELRYWFQFGGGEKLDFRGDDDVWVFVNGRLAVDLGGIHLPEDGTVTLDVTTNNFGMVKDRIYEIVVFQAERHTTYSSYKLTLRGFEKKKTRCVPKCGDGVLTPNEVCDEGPGKNLGGYGQCNATCDGYGPRCGDSVTQAESGEECDNGVNLGGYDEQGCTAQCKRASFCGDGKVDGSWGEECDDGVNDGGYNQCAASCKLGDRCGDGKVQPPETCDDANNVASDGCDNACNPSVVI